MADKNVTGFIKLQIPAGGANPAPPVGPALGAQGVNIMQFCQAFNAQTQDQSGTIIPVEITVYEDKTFSFVCKTPAAVLIKEKLGIQSGAGIPQAADGGNLVRRAAHRDRRDQDARPQRQRHRRRQGDHRRHRAFHGRPHRGPRAEEEVRGDPQARRTSEGRDHRRGRRGCRQPPSKRTRAGAFKLVAFGQARTARPSTLQVEESARFANTTKGR